MKKRFSKVLAVSALLVSMMTFAFTGCGGGKTTAEWVSQDEVQTMVSTMSNDDLSIQVVAVDDKTVAFQFTFTEQLPIESDDDLTQIAGMFDEQISAQESVFTDMRDQLVKETKINDVVLRIEYLNADGTQLYVKDYN